MSIETAFHAPLDPNGGRLSQTPSQRTIKINNRYKAEDDALIKDDHIQPRQPSLHPESNAHIPPTPTIPTLHLPIPLISLSSHTHSPSKSTKIISNNNRPPQRQNILEVVGDLDRDRSVPNSLKDLRSMTGSIYSSTLRPNSLTRNDLLNSLGGGSTTIKAPNFPHPSGQAVGGSLISLGEQLKKLDKSFIEQYLNHNSSFYDRRGSSNSSSSATTRGLPGEGTVIGGGKRGIDEVEVEWCFHCGKEGLRNDMILTEVQMDPSSVQESGLEEGGSSEGVGHRTWQWICKSGCESAEEIVNCV